MNCEQFVYWLRGFIEGKADLSPYEQAILFEKLKIVYHVPPSSLHPTLWGTGVATSPITCGTDILVNNEDLPWLVNKL